jgi:hypothetical protein
VSGDETTPVDDEEAVRREGVEACEDDFDAPIRSSHLLLNHLRETNAPAISISRVEVAVSELNDAYSEWDAYVDGTPEDEL